MPHNELSKIHPLKPPVVILHHFTLHFFIKTNLPISNFAIGFESIARGQKVLFCNFTNDEFYDIPSGYADGIWALRGPAVRYPEFRERLSKIYDLSDTEWLALTQEMGQYFVQTRISPMPQEILREEINRMLFAGSD